MTLPTRQQVDGIVRRGDRAAIREAHDQLRAGLRNRTVTPQEASSASQALAQLSAALRGDEDKSVGARTERVRRGLQGDGDGMQEAARVRARDVKERMNGS